MFHICVVPLVIGFWGQGIRFCIFEHIWRHVDRYLAHFQNGGPWIRENTNIFCFMFHICVVCSSYRFLGTKNSILTLSNTYDVIWTAILGLFSKWRPLNSWKYEHFLFYVSHMCSASSYRFEGTRNPILKFSNTYDVTWTAILAHFQNGGP